MTEKAEPVVLRDYASAGLVPRSSRSVRTGKGSRGGKWGSHPDAEYWRQWRAASPAYRARERARVRARRERARIPLPLLSEVLLRLVREEVERSSLRRFAGRLLVEHTTVYRWLKGVNGPKAEQVDALVLAFGWKRIAAGYRAEVESRRTRRNADGPVRIGSPARQLPTT